METFEKMNFKEKAKKILKIIYIMLENSSTFDKYYGRLTKEKILEIEEEQKIFENIDIEKISSIRNKFIKIEDYNDNEAYYNVLYELLLSKIYNFKTIKSDFINLFKTFNQAYYYKKYIKYMTSFLEDSSNTLEDDIMKEKMFEIVNCLNSDDKLYYQDFYFYISMHHIHNHYKKNIPIPEFEPFNDKLFEKMTFKNVLLKIKTEKLYMIRNLIVVLNYITSNKNLIELLSNIENSNSVISDEVDSFNNFNWGKLYNETEINFINYLNDNSSNIDVINLKEYLKSELELKEQFEFYYINGMESFFKLTKEEKYIIINSYKEKEKFYIHCSELYSLKRSYDEGMKDNLEDILKEIIESKEFFQNIQEIFNSEKVMSYCKYPIQYKKDLDGLKIYYEKDEEIKTLNEKNKDKIVSKFPFECNNDDGPIPDIFDQSDNKVNEKSIKEEEYICQLELDYQYFKNNVFNENFLKERIIYSFLPSNIKGFVSNVPKIVINVCGNNITSFKYDKNSDNFKTILKALYTCIIIHEFIHYIRRVNPNKNTSNEFEYTPKQKNIDYEGGQSFIYYIFGEFAIIYIDLALAKKILEINSWGEKNDTLKNELSKLKNRNKEEMIKYMEKIGGIKCYDSNFENNKDSEQDNYFYCC